MTSTDRNSTAQKLTVRSPADLIAAVPYLLGFHPRDSIVVVAVREGGIVFTARGDLLPIGAPAAAQASAAAHIAAVTGRQAADAGTVIGYGPADRVTPAVDAVGAALERAGIQVFDALRVTDGRYWSYSCDNPRCCPPEGTPYDASASPVAAAATFAGQVALPDRDALARQVAPVDGPARTAMRAATGRAAERLGALLDDGPAEDTLNRKELRAAGESAVRDAVRRIRHRGSLSDDEVAWLSLLLQHLPVRDYAWERITDDEWHVALWTDVLRRAEPYLVAAPASLLAFAAWRAGQGALASIAVERALHCTPDYSMARLMDEVLRQGLPPAKLDRWPVSDAARSRRPPRRGRGRRPGVVRF